MTLAGYTSSPLTPDVLSQPSSATSGLGSRIHARFAAVGGVDLALPERSDEPRAASFDAGGSV
jgi:hypothetical protein